MGGTLLIASLTSLFYHHTWFMSWLNTDMYAGIPQPQDVKDFAPLSFSLQCYC